MANKPNIPKGTRDFSPLEMIKRNYIFNTIKDKEGKYHEPTTEEVMNKIWK